MFCLSFTCSILKFDLEILIFLKFRVVLADTVIPKP